MPSIRDNKMAAHVAAGRTTGTFADRERLRLIALTAPSNPNKLSINDLRKLAGEKAE